MSCIHQMMQQQQRGCQWVFSDKEYRGKMFRMSDLLSRPSLQANPLSSYRLPHFLPTATRGRTLRAALWGEGASHQPGNRGSCLWEPPDNQSRTVRLCWQGEPEHLQFLQHSQLCLLDPSGNHGLQATPDCTNISMATLTHTYYQINQKNAKDRDTMAFQWELSNWKCNQK